VHIRGRVGVGVATVLVAAAVGTGSAVAAPLSANVDTRIGTAEGAADFGTGGGAGATYPGAVAPFGMVQLSPDTDPSTDNAAGGYSFVDNKVKGFSLTHISGAGCSALSDVPLMPTTHAIDASPSMHESFDVNPRYVAKYTHKGEVARPGDYRVHLNPGAQQIDAELTALTRAGALRLTFPKGSRGSVLVNAGGSAMGNLTTDLRVDPKRREISGTITSGGFCYAADRYRLHFVARFDRPFSTSGTWQRDTLRPKSTSVADTALVDRPTGPLVLQYKRLAGGPRQIAGNPTQGALAGAYASFDTRTARTVVARVAISSVSAEGARKNLAADARRSFGAMRAAATRAWERRLAAIRIGGGSATNRKLFYTALYHAQVMPNAFSDADGRYTGMDGKVHTAEGFTKYANISGWDTYRSQMPLMAMLAPREAADLASSMVADQHESGSLPKWPVLQGQTNVMVGDPADLLIAGAWAFGARGFDGKAALKAMVDGATQPKVIANGGYVQRAGLEDYLRLGYVGFERTTDSAGQTFGPSLVWGPAATTLEYALADFGIAKLAAGVGDRSTCGAFAQRSGNWRNVFDPATQSMQPRTAGDGSFAVQAPTSVDGFVEGSAAQYTWFVPHDVAGLVAALGGRDAALAKLDAFFTELNAGDHSAHAFLGNEPTLLTPYLYNWLGRPSSGASIMRRAMTSLYHPTPGGFPGNDDGGAMSSWWVFGALGLAPSVPGSGVLTLSSPLFPRATVRLAHGTLDIRAPEAAVGTPYVRSVKLGGKAMDKTWLPWSAVEKGAKLDVAVSADAKQTWGTAPTAAPPSYGGASACG
jgi:predicted alpha-1,2-mannosidase